MNFEGRPGHSKVKKAVTVSRGKSIYSIGWEDTFGRGGKSREGRKNRLRCS